MKEGDVLRIANARCCATYFSMKEINVNEKRQLGNVTTRFMLKEDDLVIFLKCDDDDDGDCQVLHPVHGIVWASVYAFRNRI